MAKQMAQQEKKDAQKFPSDYGSHASMKDDFLSSFLPPNTTYVVLRDGVGPYLTEKNRLDDGLADQYRITSVEFRVKLLKENGVDANAKPEPKIEPVQEANANPVST